jgi:hypothetical protein
MGTPGWARSSAWIWLSHRWDLLELGRELQIVDSLTGAPDAAAAAPDQIQNTELTLIPPAFAIAAPVQWLTVGGGGLERSKRCQLDAVLLSGREEKATDVQH